MYLTLVPLQEAINVLPDAVVVVNKHGKIVASNKMLTHLFGYTQAEIKGEDVSILLSERLRKIHAKHLKNYFSNPTPRKMGKGYQLFGCSKSG